VTKAADSVTAASEEYDIPRAGLRVRGGLRRARANGAEPGSSAGFIDRIKERLNRPAVLQLPAERKADFRITVTEEFTSPETVLEALRRELGGDVTPKRIP